MLSLLKYEIKNRKVALLGLAVLVLLDLVILFKIKPYTSINMDYTSQKMLFLYFLVGTISFPILIIESIKVLGNDLFGNTGYLLFTLPKSSHKILGAKILTVFLGFLVWLFINMLFGFLNLYKLTLDTEISIMLFNNLPKYIEPTFMWIITFTIGFIAFILTVYFAMTLTKSLFVNNKYKLLISFVIFMFISYIISKISNFLGPDEVLQFQTLLSGATIPVPHIGFVFLDLALGVILFFGTSYLLANRINL